jgi:prepilin-type processing-associated H-X9-DG protein
VSIIAILTALIVPGVQSSIRKAENIQCLGKMRSIGQGIQLYTQDNEEFPRSLHSAAGAGKQTWAKAILPYLGYTNTPSNAEWASIFEKLYRCPADPKKEASIYSYALNVFYELTPDGDDYTGSPQTWRKPINVDHGAKTILLAEPKPVYYADHIMCHQWTSAKGASNAVDGLRHDRKSNYVFVDGHVESLPVASTFDVSKGINLWNPSQAGK